MRKLSARWLACGLVAAAIAIAAVSCRHEPKYVIEGTLPSGQYDGEQMYLVPVKGKHPLKVDSVRISDGRFRFEGDSFVVRVLRAPISMRMYLQELVVVTEPGRIVVHIDTVSTGGGTPQNDALQAWKEHLTEYNKAVMPIWHEMRRSHGEDSLALSRRVDSLRQDNAEWTYEFLKEWKGTVAGDFVSEMCKSQLTDNQLQELYGDEDARTKDKP